MVSSKGVSVGVHIGYFHLIPFKLNLECHSRICGFCESAKYMFIESKSIAFDFKTKGH